MRDIKFRGKRIDNGEWVYGFYIHHQGVHYIVEPLCFNEGCSECATTSCEIVSLQEGGKLIDNLECLFTPQRAIDKLKQLLSDENQMAIGSRRNGKELELAIRMGIKALEKITII